MKNKALIVAISEFTTLVRSKAFIVGLLMMPVFSLVAVGVQKFTRDATDIKDRRFVVVDRTGVLYAPLKGAADEWNAAMRAATTQTAPLFLPSPAVVRRRGRTGARGVVGPCPPRRDLRLRRDSLRRVES